MSHHNAPASSGFSAWLSKLHLATAISNGPSTFASCPEKAIRKPGFTTRWKPRSDG